LRSQEKTKLAQPGNNSGSAFFSVLRRVWSPVSSLYSRQNREFRTFLASGAVLPVSERVSGTPSLQRNYGKEQSPAHLHGLIDALGKVRQRILTNTFLRGSANWWTWILVGLIVVAAASVKLAGVITLAAILLFAGMGVLLAWIWRTRLSIYDTACRLDFAAHLQDRASTAIFLADVKNPDEMMRIQREDAVARLRKVDPRGLFPVRMPAAANRVLVALLVAAGLLAYRVHHKPPLISLLQSTERSQLVQSVLNPIVHAMEKDLERTVAMMTKQDDATDEVRAGENNPPPDDLWQNGDDKQKDPRNGDQGAPDAGPDDQQQNQASTSGNQTPSSTSSESQQQSGTQSQQSQNATSSAQNKSGQQQQQESKEGEKSQSLGQSLMQALKDMMSNPQKQDSNNQGNQPSQQSNAQGTPQAGNANSTNGNPNGQKSDSRGTSDAQAKPSDSASSGAGSQAGLKQKRADFDSHQVTAVPDRVALETGTYKEQMRMRTETEAGTAQMAIRDVSSQSVAVVNGAEQENIPARYRNYVQHYFEHTDAGQQDNTPPATTTPENAQPDNGQPRNGDPQTGQQ
jgi:membrane protein implicated in regulation of membrane protease activity